MERRQCVAFFALDGELPGPSAARQRGQNWRVGGNRGQLRRGAGGGRGRQLPRFPQVHHQGTRLQRFGEMVLHHPRQLRAVGERAHLLGEILENHARVIRGAKERMIDPPAHPPVDLRAAPWQRRPPHRPLRGRRSKPPSRRGTVPARAEKFAAQLHQLRGVRVGQRIEEHGVDGGEYHRRRADADRDRKPGDGSGNGSAEKKRNEIRMSCQTGILPGYRGAACQPAAGCQPAWRRSLRLPTRCHAG